MQLLRQSLVRQDNGSWIGRTARRTIRIESLPVAGIAGLGIFNSQIDVLILGVMQGPAAAGLYQVALQGALIIAILRPRIGMIVAHRLPLLWLQGGDIDGIERAVAPVAAIVTAGATLLLVISILAGGDILAAWFGEEFRTAAPILIVISLAHLVTALTGIVAMSW